MARQPRKPRRDSAPTSSPPPAPDQQAVPAPDLPPDPPGQTALARFRDRVKDFRRVPAHTLKVNPKNWRTHPEYQTGALQTLLERVGFAGAALTRELPDGSLELLDGHLRRDIAAGETIPVLVTDLTDGEADEVLATYDAITSLAVPDTDKLADLLKSLQAQSVPLTEIGWPEYRLEQVLATAWVPPASATTEALQQAAADPAGGQLDGEAAADPGAGYKAFTVPLTDAQDAAVRAALARAKERFGVSTTGDALAAAVAEWAGWLDAQTTQQAA